MSDKRSGFTIVELLIVIVVIGILAAITIVAYNGVQAKANNTKTISAVTAYRKALLQYGVEKNSYPPLSNFTMACLGKDYSDGTCYDPSSTISLVRTTFNDALAPYLGSQLPSPSLGRVGTRSQVGAAFYYHTDIKVDGAPNPFIIVYVLSGSSSKCTIGPVLTNTWPNLTSTNADNTAVYGDSVTCWTPMPNPSTL